MGFIIEQKIKGKIYLYEATSFWDPEKKKSRQRRKYLGKKDAQTNEPVKPRKMPVVSSAMDFGHSYLLAELIKPLGLNEARSFNADVYCRKKFRLY